MKTQWWDEDGVLKFLHKFNPLRVQFVREGMANTGFEASNPAFPLKGLKIIDVGCGGGILTESLARVGAEVTGIDASDELIEVANQHIKLDSDIMERVNYISTNIEEFSKTNIESYDVVVCSEVLEHVADPDLFIKKCVEVLKPDGSIFITTINRTLCSWLGAIIVAEYMLKVIALGTHQWNKFLSPYEVQSILDKYGCKTKVIHGILVNPLTYHFKWSSYTGIFYGIHAVKQKQTTI
ncbi:ubiquinone biosynthesis O-methyltransferase, mitochondrial isoform X2 [Pseudomyrmex gracilis]|nr:ubiquinone biosynthesis O-methyltransferase, mitochondrial isoform X2 [Pseudomyrmex gracilis]